MRYLPDDYPPIDPNERGVDWLGNALVLLVVVELVIGLWVVGSFGTTDARG